MLIRREGAGWGGGFDGISGKPITCAEDPQIPGIRLCPLQTTPSLSAVLLRVCTRSLSHTARNTDCNSCMLHMSSRCWLHILGQLWIAKQEEESREQSNRGISTVNNACKSLHSLQFLQFWKRGCDRRGSPRTDMRPQGWLGSTSLPIGNTCYAQLPLTFSCGAHLSDFLILWKNHPSTAVWEGATSHSCRAAATLLGSWKWHCLYLPLLLGGSQLEGRVCMAVSRGITENETKQKKLFTRCVLSFFFTVFYYILIKVKKWEANTDYTNKVTAIFFATSVISTLWMDKSRQGTALAIYLICGAFFREQMTNLFQHFR